MRFREYEEVKSGQVNYLEEFSCFVHLKVFLMYIQTTDISVLHTFFFFTNYHAFILFIDFVYKI